MNLEDWDELLNQAPQERNKLLGSMWRKGEINSEYVQLVLAAPVKRDGNLFYFTLREKLLFESVLSLIETLPSEEATSDCLEAWNIECYDLFKFMLENCNPSEQVNMMLAVEWDEHVFSKMSPKTFFYALMCFGEEGAAVQDFACFFNCREIDKQAFTDYIIGYVRNLKNDLELLEIKKMIDSPDSAFAEYFSSGRTYKDSLSFVACWYECSNTRPYNQTIEQIQAVINNILPPQEERVMQRSCT
ncbi:MAG: hypothetical protein QNK11_07425 [Legionella sp.]|nr:hypothetical protein [Legionella sp.]